MTAKAVSFCHDRQEKRCVSMCIFGEGCVCVFDGTIQCGGKRKAEDLKSGGGDGKEGDRE